MMSALMVGRDASDWESAPLGHRETSWQLEIVTSLRLQRGKRPSGAFGSLQFVAGDSGRASGHN